MKGQSHEIVKDVKKRMLDALHAREDIARRVHSYRIEGRTKGLVSTFRKVGITQLTNCEGYQPSRVACYHEQVIYIRLTAVHGFFASHAAEASPAAALMCDRLCPRLSQVFRQNKRATDVHDILGFRVIVFPESVKMTSAAATTGEGEEITTATKGGGVATEGDEQKLVDGARHGSNQHQPAGAKKGGSKPARAVFTVKTFPPPYRDAESRLLHDVYEVLIGLFDEVPGRFKVSLNLKFTGVATAFDREYLPLPIRLGTCALFCGEYSLIRTPSLYLFFPSSRQNYVDFPKKNGYRSVHTTVLHSTGLKMEFQVRDGRNSCLYVAVGATPQSNE